MQSALSDFNVTRNVIVEQIRVLLARNVEHHDLPAMIGSRR